MKAERPKRPSFIGKLLSLAIIAAAVIYGVRAFQRNEAFPSTTNATIDTEVVHIAAVVGGRIIDIPVHENERVKKDDLLFQIDPVPYRLAVEQAEADLAFAEASLETQRRLVATQQSAATIAADQTKRAVTNLDLAVRTVERLEPLAEKGYVPKQQLDQAQTTQHDAETSLRQAREQEAAALRAVDTIAASEAALLGRRAALAIARRSLDNTSVRALHEGRAVGLSVSTGEVVAPSQTLFTLVNTEEWFAVANFRETDLKAIKPGDCATVYSMIDRQRAVKGLVQGIGAGVLDTERVNLPKSLPYVERSLNWVRVAQRFPVRIELEHPPEDLMRLGASATVEVKHGDACP